MSILTRPLLRPQQRFDLEDWNVLLSSLRTDSKFYTKSFFTNEAFIIKGFSIAQSFIGQATAEISLVDGALFNAVSSDDFSWWTAPDSPDPLTIPTGSGGLQTGRNFVEITLNEVDGTPLQRAFWDPTANSGEGIEFTNEVNTVTELFANVVVNQTSFSGDPNNIPVAIIDVDGSFVIQGIQDKRKLFFRLGEPDNIDNSFIFSTKEEPPTTFGFTVPSGTAFLEGETVSFTSGATGIVATGGNDNIEVFNFSSINFQPGDSITGGTSLASATVANYYESFSGADKDIFNFRDVLEAILTEFKLLKGTDFWYQTGTAVSLPSLLNYINTIITPVSAGARLAWDGSQLNITNDLLSGQATSDQIAAIRIPGYSGDVFLTRQDGTGGSASLGIADGFLLYVELPDAGGSRSFSEAGTGLTNYRVESRSAFIPSDKKFIIAYREGSKLIVRGSGELQSGESKQIGDETTTGQLAFTGAVDETDTTPPYTTVPSASLSNQFSSADSLTQAISINAANINDIASDLLKPYEEQLLVVSSAPADDNEWQTNGTAPNGRNIISAGTTITIPLDSRDGDVQKEFRVNSASLFMFVNGQLWNYDVDYTEVGTTGDLSSDIQILEDLYEDDVVTFRIITPQFFGLAGSPQPFFVNYITGQNGVQVPVGNLYNSGTYKLAVWRNGLFLNLTVSVGDLIDRYTEPNNNSISLAAAATPTEIFSFVNHEDPDPNVVLLTGLSGTILTVPTYTVGNGELRVFRNGVLLSIDGSAPTDLKYTETGSSQITLDLAANTGDVFSIYRSGTAPQWRESHTGNVGTLLTLGNSFTNGDPKLLVFRNGLLLQDSGVLGDPATRYQQVGTTQLSFGEALVASDFIEVIYV
jgi:hypothetical protein